VERPVRRIVDIVFLFDELVLSFVMRRS